MRLFSRLTPRISKLTWVSSNPSIVSVDKNGNIIGLKAGTANISVMTNNGKTASCTVNCIAMIPDLEISDKNGMSEIPAVANVRYDRIMYSGWNSVCVPFALDKTILDGFLEGFRMALVETFEIVGDKQFVTIKEVCFVEAGVPCLLCPI